MTAFRHPPSRTLAGLLGLLGLAIGGCRPAPANLVVRHATIIPGTGAAPIPDGVLAVSGGRVECVGTPAECPVEPRSSDVDGGGFWIIPGLIDAHAHLMFEGDPGRAERGQRLRFMLGVTTARDGGTRGNFETNIAAAERDADGRRAFSRLVVSGLVEPAAASDAESAAERVRELAARGASSIKVKAPFPDAVRAAIVAAAREAGLPVWGHAWSEDPTRSQVFEAIEAGYSGITHLAAVSPLVVPPATLDGAPASTGEPAWVIWRRGLWADADSVAMEQVARRLAESGTWLDPLLAVEELWVEPYRLPAGLHSLARLPFVLRAMSDADRLSSSPRTSEEAVRLAAALERMRRFVRRFHELGGRLVTGSDEVLVPGLSVHQEMEALTRAGLPPEAVLDAATRDAAIAIGVADSLGTLEPGKLADFVVLEGNPLADIANTQLVARVAKAGVLHDPAGLLEQLSDDLRDRTTSPGLRMIAGLLATLVTVLITALAIRRHAHRRAPRGPRAAR